MLQTSLIKHRLRLWGEALIGVDSSTAQDGDATDVIGCLENRDWGTVGGGLAGVDSGMAKDGGATDLIACLENRAAWPKMGMLKTSCGFGEKLGGGLGVVYSGPGWGSYRLHQVLRK